MTSTNPALDATVEQLMDAESVPGAAVAVVVAGETVYERGFGVADLATGRPVTPDAVFGIDSIGKSSTARV